ncbi:MAG TPA: hypothetical protein VLS27_12195 [Gammaproteobacteria bacterium]|nr:hypothetical protein [Gammaproteobacteria bacterium]
MLSWPDPARLSRYERALYSFLEHAAGDLPEAAKLEVIESESVLDEQKATVGRPEDPVAVLVAQRLHAVGQRREMGRVMMRLARVRTENGVSPFSEPTLPGRVRSVHSRPDPGFAGLETR